MMPCACACSTPDLLPPPPLGSVTVHHLPVLHKFKAQQFRHLLPQHSHNKIAVGPSFSLYNKASWFLSLFFNLASGCYNVHGYQWSNMLHDYHCSRCGQHHPFDPLSCLAICKALDQHVQAYVSSWAPPFSPIVQHWWLSGPSKADCRNLMRPLVPKSLWSCLSQPIPGSTHDEHKAMLGLALEERVKHLDKAVHQAHDWLCANPLPWVKVLPWVVEGAGGLGAGKTSGAGTRGVSLDVVIGGRTGYSNTNGGESSDNRSKVHADCYPAENPSL